MKKLILTAILTAALFAHPSVPRYAEILFNKGKVEVNEAAVLDIAKKFGISARVHTDKNITSLFFVQNPKIDAKSVKAVLEKAYKNGAIKGISSDDLKEIKENTAPAKIVFYLQRGVFWIK